MTPEELNFPRFEVLTDWPSMRDFSVGQIVILDKKFSPQYMKYEIEDCQGVRSYITKFFTMYPHLFKELKWYQRRIYTDLPKYVKWSPTPDQSAVFEVLNWYSNPNSSDIAGVYVEDAGIVGRDGRLFIEDCQPATEEAYLIFKNAKYETR